MQREQAMPIYNDAIAALNTIKEADISYIKKLANPPPAIKLVRRPPPWIAPYLTILLHKDTCK